MKKETKKIIKPFPYAKPFGLEKFDMELKREPRNLFEKYSVELHLKNVNICDVALIKKQIDAIFFKTPAEAKK